MKNIVHLLNEIAMLAKTPRSGFAFLGTGNQSVAEHTYCATIIAHVLAGMVKQPVDKHKLLLLCLFHDLAEARTGDLNYVNKRYVKAFTHQAMEDIGQNIPFGKEMAGYMAEYEKGETLEAKLVHDADQLELLLFLKREFDHGNPKAMEWFEEVYKRLNSREAKALGKKIQTTESDAWWRENILKSSKIKIKK